MKMMSVSRLLAHVVMVSMCVSVAAAFEAPTTANPAEVLRPAAPASPMDASRSNPNVFNPAIGMVLDAVAGDTHNKRGSFDFRSAEFNFMAAVDPFANLYAVINGTPDGVEVEEAAFMTTSLPWNLTVRGGRFFANFGRLPHWHDHELPFVNRTASLDSFIDGEAKSDGVEVMHLFKTPFFLQGTLGVYNKMGAENTRLEEDQTVAPDSKGHTEGRGWNAMTYLQRLVTYVPLGDKTGLDLGLSNAFTPKQYYLGGIRQDHLNSQRYLSGVDATLRYEPTGAGQVGRILWGTEVFRNDERRREELALDTDGDGVGDTDDFVRKQALGGYSYVDWRATRRFSLGTFADLSSNLDNRRETTHTYGAMLNFTPSEFQRIRLQYSQVKINNGTDTDHQVLLQWFGTIGTHVHVFKDR